MDDISGAKIANMSLSDTGCHIKTDILTYISAIISLAQLSILSVASLKQREACCLKQRITRIINKKIHFSCLTQSLQFKHLNFEELMQISKEITLSMLKQNGSTHWASN